MGFCNCSMFCCTFLYVPSSFAIILLWKRELVALLSLSSWCLVIVVWLFLTVPLVSLQFAIVVFPDHTYLLFWIPQNLAGGIQATSRFRVLIYSVPFKDPSRLVFPLHCLLLI